MSFFPAEPPNKEYQRAYETNFKNTTSYLERKGLYDIEAHDTIRSLRNGVKADLDRYRERERTKLNTLLGIAYSYSEEDYLVNQLRIFDTFYEVYGKEEYQIAHARDDYKAADFGLIRTKLDCHTLRQAFQAIHFLPAGQNYIAIPRIKKLKEEFSKGLKNQNTTYRSTPITVSDYEEVFSIVYENRKLMEQAAAQVESINDILDYILDNQELPQMDKLAASLQRGSSAYKLAKKLNRITYKKIYEIIGEQWENEFKEKSRRYFHSSNQQNETFSGIKVTPAAERVAEIIHKRLSSGTIDKNEVGGYGLSTIKKYIKLYDQEVHLEGVDVREYLDW